MRRKSLILMRAQIFIKFKYNKIDLFYNLQKNS